MNPNISNNCLAPIEPVAFIIVLYEAEACQALGKKFQVGVATVAYRSSSFPFVALLLAIAAT